jgi:hypothetical protein
MSVRALHLTAAPLDSRTDQVIEASQARHKSGFPKL